MTKREKTGVDSNVPLLEIPKQILAKYEGKLKGGKLLPVISNQKMNEYLGEIAEVCLPPCTAYFCHRNLLDTRCTY